MATKQIKGVLGEKLGMTQVFDDQGKVVPVTVLKAGPCVVTRVRTPDTDGYSAIQLGYGQINPRKVNKPLGDYLRRHGLTPRRHYVEVRTSEASEYQLGQEITAEDFEAGQKVDVTGKSKGKGFTGVMKRHGFRGLGASHGTQRKHRSPGAIAAPPRPGACSRGPRWPDARGTSARPSRASSCTRLTPRRASCSSRARFPGPTVGWCWFAPP